MNKKDFSISLIAGVITGIIGWKIFVFLDTPQFNNISYAWLILVMPVLWLIAVVVGKLLGRRFPFIYQFSKFLVTGGTNTLVDFGYLNILTAFTGIFAGPWFSLFKGLSFVFANISSYLMNKYWSFNSGHTKKNKEYIMFFTISLISMSVNVTAASLVVSVIGPQWGISPAAWVNIGAMTGSATALIVNFIGYKLLVFKT